MTPLIETNTDKCKGCNRCVRVCPVNEANIAYLDGDQVKVRIDLNKCIACGACLKSCQHEARYYNDDTDRFFYNLRNGENIALIVAPAFKTNFKNWSSILAWLKTNGVSPIADVSLGADICTWAHIRYIEQYHPKSLITQPCPAIVGYIEKYRPELIEKLSPVHSPMLCTAIYLREIEKTHYKIAALSPCVAKTNEFDATKLVSYNITFNRLAEYLRNNGIKIPFSEFEFDHIESSLGRVYSMPGGLKENIEHYLGKKIRVDKSEGQSVVYRHLDIYSKEDPGNLPVVFDVLNCPEGCNEGTGCNHEKSIFQVNQGMDDQRQEAMQKYPKISDTDPVALFSVFDSNLNLSDYIRKYRNQLVREIKYSTSDVENAYKMLGKETEEQRMHNCYACGNETCQEMAIKIAKEISIPANCMEKSRQDMLREHIAYVDEKSSNIEKINYIYKEVDEIRELFSTVLEGVSNMGSAIEQYNSMTKVINDISLQTQILSINASIEATNSGAAGKGFAVIARSIRDLATKTQKAINDVEMSSSYAATTINNIRNSSDVVDRSILTVSSYINEIAETMNIIETIKN